MKRKTIEKMEARAWLSSDTSTVRMISNGSWGQLVGEDAMSLIENIYSLGATAVYVADIDGIEDESLAAYCNSKGVNGIASESSSDLLITMPNDMSSSLQIVDLLNSAFDWDYTEDYAEPGAEVPFRWS